MIAMLHSGLIRFGVAVLGAVALASCSFDRTGAGDEQSPATADAAQEDPADASTNPADATEFDAPPMPLCKDDDGDGFMFPRIAGADCGVLDCNDSDELVNPDQDGAFTTPNTDGDFDYNCDGVETKLADTSQGEDCNRPPFGSCEGTGWLEGVPGCGESGVYHRCDSDIFSCFEAEQLAFVMPCN